MTFCPCFTTSLAFAILPLSHYTRNNLRDFQEICKKIFEDYISICYPLYKKRINIDLFGD